VQERINVTKSFLPPIEEYVELINNIWSKNNVTNRGDLVVKLESQLQDYLNSKDKPLLVCNGTIALQIAINALDIKGEIITTPFSYIATTSSIVWEGCQPVFVDIHPDYLTIDETKIEASITNRTKAILATHVYGNACNVEAIENIALKYNLKVIYDAAHCFGVSYKGKSIFDYGDVSICSFHATKVFHTGEGGAIFCNNVSKEKMHYHHNFGHKDAISFQGIGINGKMSELNAAMGISILPYIDKIINNRKNIYEYYNSKLIGINCSNILLRNYLDWNYSYYPIIFNKESELLKVKDNMNNNNIYPRRYFYPSLDSVDFVDSNQFCDISRDLSSRILCLPIYSDLKLKDLNFIIKLVKEGLCE